MAWGVSANRFLTWFRRFGPLLVALGLLPGCVVAQTGSVGFWQLSPHQEAFMLNLNPSGDAERYSTLRADFVRFGCGHRLTEQPLDVNAAKTAPHNLICTLPGKYPMPVILVAWYPVRPDATGASKGWPEAVMLPILFQALQAQPRTFTYIFAELCGEAGERVFLQQLFEHAGNPPVAFLALDELGTGVPHFATAGPRSDRQVRQILDNEGWRIANLQGYGNTPDYFKDNKELNRSVFPNRLTEPLKQTPHVLVFSEPGASVTPQLFHKDFEFLAFYLCGLDVKLDPLSGTD